MSKRQYTRRTEDEKIAELSAKIEELKQRMERKQRKDGPVFKELRKVQKVLFQFASIAERCERTDLSLMTQAFLAGLERASGQIPEETPERRRGRQPRNSLLAAG